MGAFRFRAAAALDLRRDQEADALEAKARAEAHFFNADRALKLEEVRRSTAQTDLVALERRGSDVETVLWHRNWIVRLAANVDRFRRDLDDRARDVREAEEVWHEARRRRLALERMRDRALQRFQKAELRQEMKAMDELARIRHVTADSWRSES